MASDRIQRGIDQLLDQIEQESDQNNWRRVLDLARQVLGFAPDNGDSKGFLRVAEERLSSTNGTEAVVISSHSRSSESGTTLVDEQPSSFANGRYERSKFRQRVFR